MCVHACVCSLNHAVWAASLICSFVGTSTMLRGVERWLGVQGDCKGMEEPPTGPGKNLLMEKDPMAQ